MLNKKCENCRFFWLRTGNNTNKDKTLGLCRRSSPLRQGIAGGCNTEATSWCGEYEVNLDLDLPELDPDLSSRDMLELLFNCPYVAEVKGDVNKPYTKALFDQIRNYLDQPCLHIRVENVWDSDQPAKRCMDCRTILQDEEE